MVSDAATQLFEGPDAPVAKMAKQVRTIALQGAAIILGALAVAGVVLWLLLSRGCGQ
jgi:hypothetical protein